MSAQVPSPDDFSGPGTLGICLAAVAVAAGAALGRALVRPGGWVVGSATLVAAAFICALRVRRTAIVLGLIAVAFASAANASWRVDVRAHGAVATLGRDGRVAEVCGIADVAQGSGWILSARIVTALEVPKAVAAAEGIPEGTPAWRVRERVRVTGDERPPQPGAGVCVRGRTRPPAFGGLPAVHADAIRRSGAGSVPRRWAASLRERFSAAALSALPRRQAALLLGMTDGDTAAMDEDTVEAFRTTGMAHLVAVSGQNVAILLAVVAAFSRMVVPRSRWGRIAVASVPLVAFSFLTGLEPSVLRAVVTAGLVLCATASGRRAEALRMTAGSAMLLILAVPDLVAAPGFQLSFGATLGLIAWASPVSAAVAKRLTRQNPPGRLASAVGEAFGTTLAAQAAVAPLIAASFGRLPAVGGLANIVAVPLAPAVTVGGLVTLGLASAFEFMGWAPVLLRLPLDVILWLASGFARLPAASVAADGVVAIAMTAALAAAVWRHHRLAAAFLVVAVVCGGVSVGRRTTQALRACRGEQVRALDVGQGSAVLLRGKAANVLVDGGPPHAGIVEQLRDAGVKRVDMLVVTHPHADHVRGFLEVLDRFEVGSVVGPPNVDWGVGVEVAKAAAAKGVPVRTVGAGDSLEVGDVRLEVAAPIADDVPETAQPDRIDRFSMIATATVAGVRVMLPGDADLENQIEAVASGRDLSADVLVAVHHGSANVAREFVEAVDPKMTLITVGERNRYGHPTARALRMYRAEGPVLRTDTQGVVSVCRRDNALSAVTSR